MQRASYPQGKWNAVFFLITLLVVAADQLSKTWIQSYPEGYRIFEAGLLRIIHIHNTGAAFGLFQGQSFALTIIDLFGIVVILLYALIGYHRLSPGAGRLGKSALGLVLGGTIGNVIDRLRFGYVTDFIYVGFWPAFNIADSAITVGAIIFACSLLLMTRTQKRPAG